VLASLNTARARANATKVKAQLNNLRSAAEVYYDTVGNYGALPATVGTCTGGMFSDPGVAPLIAAGNLPSGTTITCAAVNNSASTTYAVMAQLPNSQGYYCVDGTGNATTTAAATISGTDLAC
jgi:hypothetical protein